MERLDAAVLMGGGILDVAFQTELRVLKSKSGMGPLLRLESTYGCVY